MCTKTIHTNSRSNPISCKAAMSSMPMDIHNMHISTSSIQSRPLFRAPPFTFLGLGSNPIINRTNLQKKTVDRPRECAPDESSSRGQLQLQKQKLLEALNQPTSHPLPLHPQSMQLKVSFMPTFTHTSSKRPVMFSSLTLLHNAGFTNHLTDLHTLRVLNPGVQSSINMIPTKSSYPIPWMIMKASTTEQGASHYSCMQPPTIQIFPQSANHPSEAHLDHAPCTMM